MPLFSCTPSMEMEAVPLDRNKLFLINHQLSQFSIRLQERIKMIENTFLNHHQISSLSAIWKVPESIKIILIRNTFFNQSIQHCKLPQIESFQYHIAETFLLFYSNRFCRPGSPFLLRSRQIPCPAPSRAQETPSPSPESFAFFLHNEFCRLTSPFLLRSCQMPGLASFAPTTHPKNDFIPFRINHQLCRIRNRLQEKIKNDSKCFFESSSGLAQNPQIEGFESRK